MDSGPRTRRTRIGRYRIFKSFARGGMASIHLGRLVGPAGFSRLIALKVLDPLYADDEHYTMLLDEARLSAAVRHPNVVQTLDVVHDDQDLCIVMEYVHGLDLATAISSARELGEPVPPAVVSAIIAGVLHGLHAAHEARGEDGRPLGLVHRDVSPQNVLVGVDGMARVLDFGIAKALRKNHVTADGRVKGRIAYIPPEQLVGSAVTRQADVYSAGVVLWESLTAKHLFDEPNPEALAARVLEGQVPPPSTFAPHVGPALDALVLRAVAPERRDRFATAHEMAAALTAAVAPATNDEVAAWLERVAGDAIEARNEQLREAEGSVDEVEPPAGAAVGKGARGTRRPLVIAGAALVAIAGALAVAAAVSHSRASTGAPASASSSVTAASATSPAASPPPAESRAAPEPGAATSVVKPVGIPSTQPSAPRAVPASRVTRGPNCDPPFVIDAKGVKHYKMACLK